MTTDDHEIDRILSQPDEILPSSGFLAAVMDSVRREATTPPPIPFPWKRALPGILLAVLAVATVVFAGATAIARLSLVSVALRESVFQPMLARISEFTGGGLVAWTSLALLLAFASIRLSLRLVSGKS